MVAATGVILAALYLLWAYQRVFHGEPDEANKRSPSSRWREGAVLSPLLALIVFLGVYPKPVLDRIAAERRRADRPRRGPQRRRHPPVRTSSSVAEPPEARGTDE